jgi:bifunctional non-homologous end joining protein LigD
MTVVDDVAALAYVANQGMITPHVWLSTADRPDNPDRLVFDLDPGDASFAVVQDTALLLRERLDALGLVPFVKTTGSSGLHVEVPLDGGATTDEARAFADGLAARLADERPDVLTTAFRKAERGNRLYLDVARNGHAQTEVAAYGLRAKPGAPVAAPLEWDEVADATLTPQRWTVANIFRRLAQRTDPWAGLTDQARPLPAFGSIPSGYVPGMEMDEIKGKAKEAAGDLTDDKDLQREGKVDQASADIKEKAGDAVDSVKDKLHKD